MSFRAKLSLTAVKCALAGRNGGRCPPAVCAEDVTNSLEYFNVNVLGLEIGMGDFTASAEENVKLMKEKLRVDTNFDILYRTIEIGGKKAGLFFVDGFLQEDLMQKLMQYFIGLKPEDFADVHRFMKVGMPFAETEKIDDVNRAVTAILSGVTCMFIDGFDVAIGIDGRTYPMRSVDEPWKDRVMRGSRDGFVETLVFNVALIRRRIRDPLFSAEIMGVGERSRSDIVLCYIEDKVDKKFLENLKKRIQSIKVESLTMNVESLAECLLKKSWINPFPKFKYSERPDTSAAAVLDGNIVVFVDNSPAAMILPTSVFDVLEEADDFYFPPVVGTYLRWSRFIVTLVTVLLTPLWMLFLNNPQWVPEWLSFILIKDEVNVPVLLQLLLLEFCIDGLRLAAVNTPTMMSTPLSIVAGIVVGEYAVSSGWFAPEAMLYMAVVTVATYSQASFEMGYALKFVRIITLILTAIFNVWGFAAGVVLWIFMLIYNNTISGKSYMYPLIPFKWARLKRKLFRLRLPHRNAE